MATKPSRPISSPGSKAFPAGPTHWASNSIAISASSIAARPTFRPNLAIRNPPRGRANLTISTNQVAERYGACAMTLEMPFKDLADFPEPEQGWSPERCKVLARDCLGALLEWLESSDG